MSLRGNALRNDDESFFYELQTSFDNQAPIEEERIKSEQKLREDFEIGYTLAQETEARLEEMLLENESSAQSAKDRVSKDFKIRFALGAKYLYGRDAMAESEGGIENA